MVCNYLQIYRTIYLQMFHSRHQPRRQDQVGKTHSVIRMQVDVERLCFDNCDILALSETAIILRRLLVIFRLGMISMFGCFQFFRQPHPWLAG